MYQLTNSQLQKLHELKESGKYRSAKHKNTRYHEEILFEVLYRYMKMKNALNHTLKRNKFRDRPVKSNYSKLSPFHDCPLSLGQYKSAIRYGHKHNLIYQISNLRWVFSDELKRGKWKNEKN